MAFGALTIAVIVVLLWTAAQFRHATETVMRDTRSMALAHEIELELLMHQRLSNLYVLTGDTTFLARERSIGNRLARLLQMAQERVASPDEADLLATVERQIEPYLGERERIEAEGLTVPEAARLSHPALEAAVSALDSVRQLNVAQVQAARVLARRVNRLSMVVGVGVGTVLILGLVATVLALHRHALQPMLELHRLAERYRAGDTSVRASGAGSREAQALANAFNELIASQARQRENRLAFIAGVAHDLRNPLAALRLGLHALEDLPSPDDRTRVLAMLDRQVDHLTRMVTDLLDATRIEAGRMDLHLTAVDLRQVVDEVVQLQGPTWPRHRIVVDTPDHPVLTHGDPLRLEQVLSNLLSNAVKFSAEGSRIDITVREEADVAVLEVRDEGIGMTPNELRELFVPFRRQRPDVAPGAGLGLSVVRRIVTAHGGRVEVDSAPGRGSTFRVRLPALRDDPTAELVAVPHHAVPHPTA
ncbi:MAG TPA: HAMP domain-containing sensor histidine kinase [Gemmatimonadaceae bacterium]